MTPKCSIPAHASVSPPPRVHLEAPRLYWQPLGTPTREKLPKEFIRWPREARMHGVAVLGDIEVAFNKHHQAVLARSSSGQLFLLEPDFAFPTAGEIGAVYWFTASALKPVENLERQRAAWSMFISKEPLEHLAHIATAWDYRYPDYYPDTLSGLEECRRIADWVLERGCLRWAPNGGYMNKSDLEPGGYYWR